MKLPNTKPIKYKRRVLPGSTRLFGVFFLLFIFLFPAKIYAGLPASAGSRVVTYVGNYEVTKEEGEATKEVVRVAGIFCFKCSKASSRGYLQR